jgi:hypothetical protein
MKLRATIQIEQDYSGNSMKSFWRGLRYGDVLHCEMDTYEHDNIIIHKNKDAIATRLPIGNFNQVMKTLKHTTLQT